jgi:hypothetical protein
MLKKEYSLKKLSNNLLDIDNVHAWQGIKAIKINDYLWMQNDYRPAVVVKACYSDEYIYVKFLVYEKRVRATYLNVGDPVYKDSCVEFFINLFPKETEEYFNIELNAIGTIKMGYGIKRNRKYLTASDLSDMKVITSIKQPVTGFHGSDYWKLYCAIPIKVLEKISKKIFNCDDAIGNFYKCGDETEFKHYGMWNLIDNPIPDFHIPEYFGKIIFDKNKNQEDWL